MALALALPASVTVAKMTMVATAISAMATGGETSSAVALITRTSLELANVACFLVKALLCHERTCHAIYAIRAPDTVTFNGMSAIEARVPDLG